MCGIAGFFNLPGSDAELDALLERMNRFQAHRGPDGEGFFREQPVGLAHRRLSIIDEEGGAQPMFSADGRYALVYNGEVYNYKALRAELEALGRHFTTQSDSEVVLQAFAEWGSASFDRMNGMWGLAIYDRREQRLTLSRDHFGIKPLNYALLPATAEPLSTK
jgi:asparagine synthase (glutamine-hydrolysing)